MILTLIRSIIGIPIVGWEWLEYIFAGLIFLEIFLVIIAIIKYPLSIIRGFLQK